MQQLCLLYAVCLYPTDDEVKSGVDIGDGSSVEIVDEFCKCLAGYLFVNGDAGDSQWWV